ncbi:MAG TPA: hypothetical protein VMF52_04500 [Steroidobacteraceae bacterium]|nr:hypothetical protein [Steroidobacteraceae bacterium]
MLTTFRRGAVGVIAALALGSGLASSADEPVPMTIYDTALAPGWENWSWAKTELSVELGGSARRPIRVEAAPWSALYLHHAPFSTQGYKALGLLIQGSVPDREVRVFLLTDGKVNGEGKLVKIGNTGWTKVEVPLVTLGAEDRMIDGFWVQNASGTDLPKFYVTEIRLQ